jgi:hypothetical protein
MPAMVRPDLQKWSLSLEALTELSVYAPHPRTRERLLALVLLAQGQCAWGLCRILGRDVHTLLKWVHDFNQGGPTALIYRRTGGSAARRWHFAPLVKEAVEQARAAAALPVSKKASFRC